MKPKVIFILLDAFRGDYINDVDTPFLSKKSKEGVFAPKLKSVAGFGQRTAIYSGTTGDKSGVFTMFKFDSDNSTFKFLNDDPKFRKISHKIHWWEKLPNLRGFGRIKYHCNKKYKALVHNYRQEIKKTAQEKSADPQTLWIPLEALPHLALGEDEKPIHLPGGCEVDSIFDVFSKAGISYKYLMYPIIRIQDNAVLEALLDPKNASADVLLAQFSDCDYLMHVHGPGSAERHKVMAEVDWKLRKLYAHFGDEPTWILIGDHGMADIEKTFDVLSITKELESSLGVEHGVDYVVLLDSTMARFKWLTGKGARLEDKLLDSTHFLENGRFIDEEIAAQHHIPIENKSYGDLMWWANVGVLIFPDYFHAEDNQNKGMHGYDSTEHTMKGFFLAFGNSIQQKTLDEVNLIDVCPAICNAAGVKPPKENEGKLPWQSIGP